MWPCGVPCSPEGSEYNKIFQLSQSISPHSLLVSPYLTPSPIIKQTDCSPARGKGWACLQRRASGYLSPSRGPLLDAAVLFYVSVEADGNDSQLLK